MKQVYAAVAAMVVVLAASEYYTFQSGLATSELVPALLNKDVGLFRSLLLKFTFLIAISAVLSSLTSLASSYVAYTLRFYMLEFLQSHFKLVAHDFDQRWTMDLDLLSSNAAALLLVLIPAPFMIVFYWIQSAQIAGNTAPVIVLVYIGVTSIIAGIVGKRLPSYVYDKERHEGILRLELVHIRNFLEEIQMYGGSKSEMKMINKSVIGLKLAQLKVLIYLFVINTWSKLISYCGGLMPYFCISFAVFNHQYDDIPTDQLAGKIQMASFVLLMLMNRFTTIVEQFSVFFQFLGYYRRVKESVDLFNAPDIDKMTTKYQSETFGIQQATATINDKNVFENKTILLHQQNVLLTGLNGSGKTSLARLISRAWPESTGTRVIPKNKKWMILPSKSYFLQGTLLENIIYPQTNSDNITTNEIEEILVKMGLKLDLGEFSDKNKHFLNVELPLCYYASLSAGEQQKLCLCRVLFYKPDYLIMDESLNHLDAESVGVFYEILKVWNCVYMTITHDGLLEEYHNTVIDLSETDENSGNSRRTQRFGLF